MVPDFSEAYSGFIKISDDGTLNPPVTFWPLPGEQWDFIAWADPDGLMVSVTVPAPSGEPCLLTALFPMEFGRVAYLFRKKILPLNPTDGFTVKRKIDEVVGGSGERYARFEVVPQALQGTTP